MHRHAGSYLFRPLTLRTALARHWAPRQTALPRSFPQQTSRETTRCFASVHEIETDAPQNSSHDPEDTLHDDDDQYEQPRRPIRELLRSYVKGELPAGALPLPRDYARIGTTKNSLTRTENQSIVDLENASDVVDEAEDVFDLGRAGSHDDVLVERPYGAVRPQAGDMVEVTTESWRVQLLAVCLGNFRGADHFYTNTGKWFVSSSPHSLFGVTNFATAEEMAPVIAALPAAAVVEGYDKGMAAGSGTAAAGATEADRENNGPIEANKDGVDVSDVDSMLNSLQDLKLGPSREAGALLIRKMNAFAQESAAIHMSHSAVLDNAFYLIQEQPVVRSSSPSSRTESLTLRGRPYATLHNIAATLLRKSGHKIHNVHHSNRGHGRSPPIRTIPGSSGDAHDEFTPAALYAVHRAVRANDVAFQPLSSLDSPNSIADEKSKAPGKQPVSRVRSCLYSILPASDMKVIRNVELTARLFYKEIDLSSPSSSATGKADRRVSKMTELDLFLAKAQRAIDRSRQTREWLPFGMVGPTKTSDQSKNKTESGQTTTLHEHWTEGDLEILRFIHMWASFQRFSSGSRLHWIGAAILRATERYKESEYLTMTTGWTFLQEVGWITPWDIPSRYSLSLPDVLPLRAGGLERPLLPGPQEPPKPPAASSKAFAAPPALAAKSAAFAASAATTATSAASLLEPDPAWPVRKKWNMTVYCIDAPGATDIDDGISITRTDKADEFWIRVHVADPASRIAPGSPLAQQASLMPQTAYLPGHFARMFPDDTVREQFSLAPGRPCLTFSAKVNLQGTVLDSKIEPGTIQHVVFISPSEVSSLVAGAESDAIRTLGENDNYLAVASAPAKLDLPSSLTSFSVGEAPREPIREDAVQPTATPDNAKPSVSTPGKRTMSTAADLTDAQQGELKTLTALATALRSTRLTNGAMPLYWPRPNVEVSLANTTVTPWTIEEEKVEKEERGAMKGKNASSTKQSRSKAAAPAPVLPMPSLDPTDRTFVQCTGDPYIHIWYDQLDDGPAPSADGSPADSGAGSRLVESTMRLAGEVAADWCDARGISVPFRGQPDAAPHRARLQTLTRDSIYPALATGRRPPESALREMRRLLGADDMTAVAVPHVTMGVERYTKATSPLRRYSDLVVHWQIWGWLKAQRNPSLETTSSSASGEKGVLPFTRAQMETEIIPQLRMRERALRALDNRTGRDQWMLQALVRGWQADPAAYERLSFTVSRVVSRLGVIMGRLDWFERVAVMEASGLLGYKGENGTETIDTPLTPMHFDDVQPGQVITVALQHVNVHSNRVMVRRVE